AELLDVWPVDHVDDDVIAEVRPQHLQVEQGVAPVLADGRLVWPSQRNARGFGQRRAESDPCIRCAAAQQVRDVEGTVQREIAAQTPRDLLDRYSLPGTHRDRLPARLHGVVDPELSLSAGHTDQGVCSER